MCERAIFGVVNSFTVKKVSFFTINVKFKVILSSKSGGGDVCTGHPPTQKSGGGGYIPIPPGFTQWCVCVCVCVRACVRVRGGGGVEAERDSYLACSSNDIYRFHLIALVSLIIVYHCVKNEYFICLFVSIVIIFKLQNDLRNFL